MKVIFHVDEMSKWTLTMGNIKNLISYTEERNIHLQAVVLANSAAVAALTPAGAAALELHEALLEIMDRDISVSACRNALNKEKIAESELITGVVVVPAGVAELVQKQAEGYAYIRP